MSTMSLNICAQNTESIDINVSYVQRFFFQTKPNISYSYISGYREFHVAILDQKLMGM